MEYHVDKEIRVNVFDHSYVDMGAIATFKNNNINKLISESNDIDFNKLGSYEIVKIVKKLYSNSRI